MIDREVVRLFAQRCNVPRVAVSLTIGSNTEHLEFANFGDEDEKTPRYFMLASICKLVTALSLVALDREGSLKLGTTAHHFFPELQQLSEFPTHATIADFLNHRSGMERTQFDWRQGNQGSTKDWLLSSLKPVAKSGSKVLRFSADRSYSYSNFNFQILSPEVGTFLDISTCRKIAATPHVDDGEQTIPALFPIGFKHYHPSATMYSRIPDVHRFFNSYFSNSIGRALIDLCEGNLSETGIPYARHYGSCFFKGTRPIHRRDRRRVAIYGHGGKELGYNNLQLIIPEVETTISIACNNLSASTVELAFALLRGAFLTHPSSAPQ